MRGLALLFILMHSISGLAKGADVIEAARRSDLESLKKSVRSTQDANRVESSSGETPLLAAAEGGETAVLSYLLDKGANINGKDRNGQTALFRAISAGNDEAARLLIQRGADLKIRYGPKQENILFEATRLGAEPTIRELLKKRKDLLSEANADGETAIFEAVRSAQNEVARLFVKEGANPEARNKQGRLPRDFADTKTDQEMLKILKAKKR